MMITRVSSQTPLASLTVSSLSRQTDNLSVKDQMYRTLPERSELDHLIGTASTVEDLLHLGELYPVNGNQAAMTIIRLSRIVGEKKLEPGHILEDARFQHLLQTMHRQVSSMAVEIKRSKGCFLAIYSFPYIIPFPKCLNKLVALD